MKIRLVPMTLGCLLVAFALTPTHGAPPAYLVGGDTYPVTGSENAAMTMVQPTRHDGTRIFVAQNSKAQPKADPKRAGCLSRCSQQRHFCINNRKRTTNCEADVRVCAAKC